MSKVAITGNTSGTGTFTIAAPNSNTDRILTLPDEAGTVLTSGATVSDVPTLIKEGTWTPAANFETPATAGATAGTGHYQRIGNYVTVHFKITNVDTTGASGICKVSGLPYTVATNNSVDVTYGTALFNNVNIAGGSAYDATSEAYSGTDTISFRTNEDNAASAYKEASHFTDDVTDIRGTVTYYTTDAF
jgi:hypothetical protein